MAKSNDIINSLKRLERVGDETSRVTQKLKASCVNVAQKILDIIKDSGIIDVPDYYYRLEAYNLPCYLVDKKRFTMKKSEIEDVNERRHIVRLYVDCQDNWWLAYDDCDVTDSKLTEMPSRSDALSFSWIVNRGLIQAVANWIESEKQKTLKRIQMIENN